MIVLYHLFIDTQCPRFYGMLYYIKFHFFRTSDVTVELTIDKLHKRALVYHKNRIFVDTFKFSTTLRRGEEKCVPVKITLKVFYFFTSHYYIITLDLGGISICRIREDITFNKPKSFGVFILSIFELNIAFSKILLRKVSF